MSQTFKVYLCSVESLKSLSICGAPASLRAEDVQTQGWNYALWHSVRAFWRHVWCPKCGWSAFTFGPDEATGTLVSWSGIDSVLIWTRWWHLGPSGGWSFERMMAYLGGKTVPVGVFLSGKLRGSSIFSSRPFLLLWPETHACVQVSDSVQRYELQPARLLCP